MKRWAVILIGLMFGAGCATAGKPAPQTQSASATQPSTIEFAAAPSAHATLPLDPIARLTLDQIEPVPELPAPQPATQPALPPLDAIELYARARDAQNQRQRYSAINLIENALELDPDSYELNFALGRAYLAANGSVDRALAALEHAARVSPNDIDVQFELGRVHQVRSDLDQAIEQYRLAMLTDEYRDDDPLAAVVDYRLGVLLEQRGYARAALQCYQRLQHRLDHPSIASQTMPEISFLMARPESLYEAMGALYEKLGELPQALVSYRAVADRSPNDFDLRTRVVKILTRLGRKDEATSAAAQLVRHFHASSPSLELMRGVYRDFGAEGEFVGQLESLYNEQPGDRAILFALADTLAASGQLDRAGALLDRAIRQRDGDVEIIERLIKLYSDRDQVIDAARTIVRITSEYPDTTTELTPLFDELLRLSRKNTLRSTAMTQLEVAPDQQAARQYWLWYVLSRWTRISSARAALEHSAEAPRPFDPACRALLDSYFSRGDWGDADKQRASLALIESVSTSGREDLAAELRGMLALHNDNVNDAARWFAEALRLSKRPSPDLQLNYAVCMLRHNNAPRFEQLMWKLLSDRPRYDDGYVLLLSYFRQRNDASRAWDLVDRWLTADPSSIRARAERCLVLVEQRRGEEALASIRRLFEQHPDNQLVVVRFVQFFHAANQPQQVIDALEAERAAHPNNRVAVETLVEIYAARNQSDRALAVLESARAAVADDPDLLYYVAHLYQRIDQQPLTEQVLQDVLKLDPKHAPAGNDLGYTWADAGKHLDRAEVLVRMAVDAEPDNPSYLDSLGWVLYKRGKFDEARKLLEQASEPLDSADPVVLDHLADTLYRLDRIDQARQMWQRTKQRLENVPPRDEFNTLRTQLETKLKQIEAAQPVDVAPIVESSQTKTQAKN